MLLQSVIQSIYPMSCVACDAPVQSEHGLCAACWADTSFADGLICNSCGTVLPGEGTDDLVQCDDCLTIARPWSAGRTVLAYGGVGRRLVLALKHGDRTDLVPTLAGWMARPATALLMPDSLIVPVPLHWTRLVRRRYNQSALLAQALGKRVSREVCVDGLLRPKRTVPLDGHTRDARFGELSDAIIANPKQQDRLRGRPILLIDDVMTSGATLAAGSEALRKAGAGNVSILTLARVTKDT